MANKIARRLRNNMTLAERRLWRELKTLKRDGYHFRRQVPIEGYIVDFACFGQRLVIEVDGGQHATLKGQSADSARDAHLGWHGFDVLRFWNNEVLNNTEGVLFAIRRKIDLDQKKSSPLLPCSHSAFPPLDGEG